MRRLDRLQRTAILLGVASAILWVIVWLQVWVDEPLRVLRAVEPTAGTLAIVATIMWIGGRNGRRTADVSEQLAENNRVLAETVGRVILPAAPARRTGTGPLRAV